MASTRPRKPHDAPIRIIRSTDTAAVSALLDRRPARNGTIERAVAGILDGVRRGGDRALRSYAKQFDRLQGDIEVPAREIRDAARQVPPDVRRAIRAAAANIRRVAARQVPQGWTMSPSPGVRDHPAGHAARPGRLLRAGRALSAALVVADDRDPGDRRGSARRDRGVPAPGRHRAVRGAGSRRQAAVPHRRRARRSPRSPTARRRFRASTRSSVRATPTWRPPRRWWPPTAPSTSSPDRARSRSYRRPDVPEWIAADLIAQAEHDPDARAILFTPVVSLALAVAGAIERQLPDTGRQPRSRWRAMAASWSRRHWTRRSTLCTAARARTRRLRHRRRSAHA